MKKMLIFGIAVLFIFAGLSGCFDSNKGDERNSELDRFVGTWIRTAPNEIALIFSSNGTGSYSGDPIEWKIKDGKLEVYWLGKEETITYDFEFEEDDKVLMLTDVASENSEVYTKQ